MTCCQQPTKPCCRRELGTTAASSCNGRLSHYLNGKQVVECACTGPEWDQMIQTSKFKDWPFGKAKTGRMALQDHGDAVAFRNLRIKQL